MGRYMVVYYYGGSEHLYGYADSIGEAIEDSNNCRDEGYTNCRIKAWDEITGRWVMIN